VHRKGEMAGKSKRGKTCCYLEWTVICTHTQLQSKFGFMFSYETKTCYLSRANCSLDMRAISEEARKFVCGRESCPFSGVQYAKWVQIQTGSFLAREQRHVDGPGQSMSRPLWPWKGHAAFIQVKLKGQKDRSITSALLFAQPLSGEKRRGERRGEK